MSEKNFEFAFFFLNQCSLELLLAQSRAPFAARAVPPPPPTQVRHARLAAIRARCAAPGRHERDPPPRGAAEPQRGRRGHRRRPDGRVRTRTPAGSCPRASDCRRAAPGRANPPHLAPEATRARARGRALRADRRLPPHRSPSLDADTPLWIQPQAALRAAGTHFGIKNSLGRRFFVIGGGGRARVARGGSLRACGRCACGRRGRPAAGEAAGAAPGWRLRLDVVVPGEFSVAARE